jgi:hypothetical protein
MTFQEHLDRCIESMEVRKDALLPDITVWQVQIENAIATHANVSELETTKMGE